MIISTIYNREPDTPGEEGEEADITGYLILTDMWVSWGVETRAEDSKEIQSRVWECRRWVEVSWQQVVGWQWSSLKGITRRSSRIHRYVQEWGFRVYDERSRTGGLGGRFYKNTRRIQGKYFLNQSKNKEDNSTDTYWYAVFQKGREIFYSLYTLDAH